MNERPAPPSDEFIRLLTSHQTQLRGVILAGLGNYEDCQDVLQKTNLAIWKKAVEFDENKSFLAWAIGIARFEILAYMRDRQRDRHVFDPEVADLLIAQAGREVGGMPERQVALRECIRGLSERNRNVLQLKYVRNNTITAISDVIGRSHDGVKSLLLRVRKVLAECIERRLAANPDLF